MNNSWRRNYIPCVTILMCETITNARELAPPRQLKKNINFDVHELKPPVASLHKKWNTPTLGPQLWLLAMGLNYLNVNCGSLV